MIHCSKCSKNGWIEAFVSALDDTGLFCKILTISGSYETLFLPWMVLKIDVSLYSSVAWSKGLTM